MESQSPRTVALRWIGGHVMGMVALEVAIELLTRPFFRGWSGSWAQANLVMSLTAAVRFVLAHALAVRWVGLPVPLVRWSLLTGIGVALGETLTDRLVEYLFRSSFRPYLPDHPTLAVLLAGGVAFFSAGLLLALPQAGLLGSRMDRRTAILWGAWTLGAWMTAEYGFYTRLWFAPSTWFETWPLDQRGFTRPAFRAVWAILFAALTLPAVRRVLAPAPISR